MPQFRTMMAGLLPRPPRTFAQWLMEAAYARWPDLHVEVLDCIAEGDRVMVRNRWRATEKSSGRRVEFSGFVLWRFANRQIVERWATLTPPREIP